MRALWGIIFLLLLGVYAWGWATIGAPKDAGSIIAEHVIFAQLIVLIVLAIRAGVCE